MAASFDAESLSVEIIIYDVGKCIQDLIFHPTLNTIIVINSDSTIQILDASSGLKLTESDLNSKEQGQIKCAYLPKSDRIIFTKGNKISCRSDFNGIVLLSSALQPIVSSLDETIRLELALPEANNLYKALNVSDLENVEYRKELIDILENAIVKTRSEIANKNHKIAKWAVVCIEAKIGKLKTICSHLVDEMKRDRCKQNLPGLPVASSVVYRLQNLIENHATADIRSLMCSEEVRRNTFSAWPHMSYKWALPEAMAEAGFYHQPNTTGEDRALCFTCNVCLVYWEPCDEPWSEHERHSPNCPFVKGDYTNNIPLSVSNATERAITVGPDEINILGLSYCTDIFATGNNKGDIILWDSSINFKKLLEFSVNSCDTAIVSVMEELSSKNNHEYSRPSREVNLTSLCVTDSKQSQYERCLLIGGVTLNCTKMYFENKVDDLNELNDVITSGNIINKDPCFQDEHIHLLIVWSLPNNNSRKVWKQDVPDSVKQQAVSAVEGGWDDDPYFETENINFKLLQQSAALSDDSSQKYPIPGGYSDDNTETFSIDKSTPPIELLECITVSGEVINFIPTIDQSFLVVSVKSGTKSKIIIYPFQNGIGSIIFCEKEIEGCISQTCLLRQQMLFNNQDIDCFDDDMENEQIDDNSSNNSPIEKKIPYGMIAVLLKTGEILIIDLSNLNILMRITDDIFISITYCSSLDKLCAATSNGSLKMFSFTLKYPCKTLNSNSLFFTLNETDSCEDDRQNIPDLNLISLRYYHSLLKMQTLKCHITAPQCWTEIQNESRRYFVHQQTHSYSRTWRLEQDSYSWDEHLFDISLHKPSSVAHVDLTIKLRQTSSNELPSIQLTLLKQYSVASTTYQRRNTHKTPIPGRQLTNPVFDKEFLLEHNAQILVGPIELSQYVDVNGKFAYVTLSSPELTLSKCRNLLLHMKCTYIPSNAHCLDKKLKQRKSDEYLLTSQHVSSKIVIVGCDTINEISIATRKFKKLDLKEKSDRLTILRNKSFLEKIVNCLIDPDNIRSEQERLLCLDILQWNVGMHLFSKLENALVMDVLMDKIDSILTSCLLNGTRYESEKIGKLLMLSFDKQRCSKYEAKLLKSLLSLLPYIENIYSSNGLYTLFLLLDNVKSADINLIGEECIKALNKIGKAFSDRDSEEYAILRSKFDLYGRPFDPLIFHFQLNQCKIWNKPPALTYATAVSSAGQGTAGTVVSVDGMGISVGNVGGSSGVIGSGSIGSSYNNLSESFEKSQQVYDWHSDNYDFTQSSENKRKNHGSPYGLLDVEPLHLSVFLTSEGIRLENTDSAQTNITQSEVIYPPYWSNNSIKQDSKLSSLVSMPTTPKSTPQAATPQGITPSASPPLTMENLQNIPGSGSHSPFSLKASSKNELISHSLSTISSPLTLPPAQVLLVDGMHSGARRFIVFDIGRSVTLTDVMIPVYPNNVASLAIDVWDENDENHSQRILFTTDIFRKPVHLSCLSPPPLCRFIKLTATGGHGCCASRTLLPVGHYFGFSLIETENQAVHRLSGLNAHYDDVHCKYSLACHKLALSLHSLSTSKELSNITNKKSIKELKDSYYACLQLQLQMSFVQRALYRLRRMLGHRIDNEEVPTDKLIVIAECLLSSLLNLTLCSINMPINVLGNNLNPDLCNNLMQSLCIKGTPKLQYLTGILLVRVHGSQNWWGTFIGNNICKFYSHPNCNFIPKRRLLSLFTLLGHKSICNVPKAKNYLENLLNLMTTFLMPLLEILAKNGTDEEIANATVQLDLELLTWIFLFLSKNLEVVTNQIDIKTGARSRWCFSQSDVKPINNELSNSSNSRQAEKLYARKLQKRMLHNHKQELLDFHTAKLNTLQNILPINSKEAEKLVKKEKQINITINKTLKKQFESKSLKDARRKNDELKRSSKFDVNRLEQTQPPTVVYNSILDIEKEKCIPVVKGLVGLLLTIDVSSNVDLLLVLCKLIAKISHLPKPNINLSDALNSTQLRNLMILQAECDTKHSSAPWTAHAINSLLFDLVKHQQSELQTFHSQTKEVTIDYAMNDNKPANNSNCQAASNIVSAALSNVVGSSTSASKQTLASAASKVIEQQMDISLSDEDLPMENCSDKEGNMDSSSDDCILTNFEMNVVGSPVTILPEQILPESNIYNESEHLSKKNTTESKNQKEFKTTTLSNQISNISTAIDSRTQIGLDILADLKIRVAFSFQQERLYLAFISPLPLSTDYGYDLCSNLNSSSENEIKFLKIIKMLNIKSSTNEELVFNSLTDLVCLFKQGKLFINTLLNMWSSLANILDTPSIKSNLSVAILIQMANNLFSVLSTQHFLNVTTSVLALNILNKLCISEIVANELAHKEDLYRLLKSLLTDMNSNLAGPTVSTALTDFMTILQKTNSSEEISFRLARDICQFWPRGPIDLQHSFLTILDKSLTTKKDITQLSSSMAFQYIECVSQLLANELNQQTGNITCQTSIESSQSSYLENLLPDELHKDEKVYVTRNSLLALTVRICTHLMSTFDDDIDKEILYKYFATLNDCSSNTLSMLISAAGVPTPPQITDRMPNNVYDEVFALILAMDKHENNQKFIISALVKLLTNMHKLSQTVLWLSLTILCDEKKLLLFLEYGGVDAICQQLIQNSKFSLCSWPPFITEMLEEENSFSTIQGTINKIKEEENGLKNLAPLAKITTTSKSSAVEGLLHATAPHRRARSATWTHHFSTGEVWVDLTLKLPFVALLYQVNISPHVIALSTSPYLVSLETSIDGNQVAPLCEPLHTAGMTMIKLKLSSPTVVTSVTIRLHRPLDNATVGLSQIMLLGRPAFFKVKNGSFETSNNRKSGAAWIKLLQHCLKPTQKYYDLSIKHLMELSLKNKDFIKSCVSLTITNSCFIYGDALEDVIIKLGSCEENLSKSVLKCILSFTESTEMSVEIFIKLASRLDEFTNSRLIYILEWLKEVSSNLNKKKLPASRHIQAVGNVLWKSFYNLQQHLNNLTPELLLALFDWAVKSHDSTMKCAIETVICSICMQIPDLLKYITENSILLIENQQGLSTLAAACSSKRAVLVLLESKFLANFIQRIRNTFTGDNTSLAGGSFQASMHAPVLKFLARVSTVILFQDFLGSLGHEFWTGLLHSVCSWKNISDYIYKESVHTACIELLRALTLCHENNQKLIANCLCHILQASQNVPAFLRRILLQVLLEHERITVNVNANLPITSSLNYSGLSAHPRHAIGLKGRCLLVSLNTQLSKLVTIDPLTTENDQDNLKELDEQETERKKPPSTAFSNYYNASSSAHLTSASKRVKKLSKCDTDSKSSNKTFKIPIIIYFSETINDKDNNTKNHVEKISPKLQISSLLHLYQNKRDENIIDLFAHDSFSTINDSIVCNDFSSSTLNAFADCGGLALLADRLPLLHSVAQAVSINVPSSGSGKQFSDDWITLESGDDLFDDLNFISSAMNNVDGNSTVPTSKPSAQLISASSNNFSSYQPAPPHSLLIFGLCLRLPKYADVLLRNNKYKAVSLMRLALGVADDAAGVPIVGSEAAQGLSILPLVVLNDLLELTSDDDLKLRQRIYDFGIVHVLLSVLAVLTHQPPLQLTCDHMHTQLILAATQSARLLISTSNNANNKKGMAEGGSKKSTINNATQPIYHQPIHANTMTGVISNQIGPSAQYWAKGTGFGTGSTVSSWDAEQALLRQRSEEDHISAIFHALAAFFQSSIIMNKKCGLTEDLYELFNASCLITAICSYLRNDSVLDMSRHVPLYKALLRLLRSISGVSILLPLLTKLQATESEASLFSLLLSMKCCVDTYASRLAAKMKTGSHEDESSELSHLIADIKNTAKIVDKATIGIRMQSGMEASTSNDDFKDMTDQQTIEKIYMKKMKCLQFDTYNMVATEGNSPPKFLINHHFSNSVKVAGEPTGQNAASRARRLAQEAVTLSTSLPLSASSSVFVRCDEERLDVMKVLITGPDGTPYANGCFEFDVYFPLDYPSAPPHVHLCTTGNRSVRFNPNLYNDGKVCLSVLNTWHGRPEEKWNATTSSLLQVLVSIQSLILVCDPYFNEPGYERSRGSASGEASSREYDANIRQATVRWGMLDMLQRPPMAFKNVIKKHFSLKRQQIIKQLDEWISELQSHSNDRRSGRAITQSLSSLKIYAGQVKEELKNISCSDDEDNDDLNVK